MYYRPFLSRSKFRNKLKLCLVIIFGCTVLPKTHANAKYLKKMSYLHFEMDFIDKINEVPILVIEPISDLVLVIFVYFSHAMPVRNGKTTSKRE